MKIEFMTIDITKMRTDAVVNAANEALAEGGGVCGAVFKAAGREELTRACTTIGHCDTGNAVITPGFHLNARYIIHAVGPVWHGGNRNEEKLLSSCYRKSLELAMENNCHSIAFPLISSSIYGYPKKEAWHTALKTCCDFLEKHADYDLIIYFCVLDIVSELEGIEEFSRIKKKSEKVILFHDPDEKPYGCFSNWYPCSFTIEGITYLSSEQYMMAKKALLFSDLHAYTDIMHTDDPAECQKLGRNIHNFDQKKWDEAKYSIVYHGVKAKFSENDNLKKILLHTGTAVIGEAAGKDIIWGIGMHDGDTGADNPDNWKGKNLFGKILMNVRNELK